MINRFNKALTSINNTLQQKAGTTPNAIKPERNGIALPSHRQPFSVAIQPKQSKPASISVSSLMLIRPTGIIQANLIGGTLALKHRLSVMPHLSDKQATIQMKRDGNIEAFQVSLQPKRGGNPLPDAVRQKMESAFGADFSDVRIHVGPEAASIGALAYTWGTNIHFAPGQYNPWSVQGQKIIGHELWHVLQQKSGRVKNPFGGGVAVVQDQILEAEADRMGAKAAMVQFTMVNHKAR